MKNRKVFIVGAGGMVGATAAYSIAIQEVAHEIVLIDVAEALVAGQSADIWHATSYGNGIKIRVGNYSDIAEDDIIVITCGANQKPGQPRSELLHVNATIIRSVIEQVRAQSKPVYIVMVTNPVDVLTMLAVDVSGLTPGRVFGSGTALDTARLKVMLADQLKISPKSITAYVLGEHGDTSFPALSSTTVGGLPLTKSQHYNKDFNSNIEQAVRQSAYEIIDAKQSTYYGIGQTIAEIVKALLSPTPHVMAVSTVLQGQYGLSDIAISLPTMVSDQGVTVLADYPLSSSEHTKLAASADVIKAAYAGMHQFLA